MDLRVTARFEQQPGACSLWYCGNKRRWAKGKERLTLQQRRAPTTGQQLAMGCADDREHDGRHQLAGGPSGLLMRPSGNKASTDGRMHWIFR